MMIPTRWRDVKAADRVMDPTGAVFHVLPRVVPFLVQLRPIHSHGRPQTVTIAVNPDAHVPVIFDPETILLNAMREHFPTIEPL